MSDSLVGRRSLADTVFERIQRSIKSGAYAVDERLPTEHALASEFQVSRPVIRDALQRLRDQGLIYSRRGAGSFVREQGVREPLGFGQMENLSDLQHCYDFRLTIEPEAAAVAARRHTPESLQKIRTALNLLRDATNRQAHRADADFMFHLSIAQAAGNPYFVTAMQALEEHIAVGMRLHGLSLKSTTDGLARVLVEHADILAAIAASDAELAHNLMRDHLQGSRDRLFLPQR
ncbi:GntR family transcriptional regulator, transcriptional repressor for pyruvate dehydrogenase complex [Devosia lucknowensis]|uniref:GntR family transcriptional regulator, transcriptional repressor for pyruvate dehydrogenase complex n=1 Tax=Devosia lucknowensis TaxID=1096929 RepID=A0A1Y6F3T3_9HYPH|nr:FadR/GntR family transcriptional regulator [Devosia lucknowensis]SMQ69239.1 GntR family transcriptional regulator, transcriptional repressor for pyruvate dehydrogenase complex [Devosia lucknowensis]